MRTTRTASKIKNDNEDFSVDILDIVMLVNIVLGIDIDQDYYSTLDIVDQPPIEFRQF